MKTFIMCEFSTVQIPEGKNLLELSALQMHRQFSMDESKLMSQSHAATHSFYYVMCTRNLVLVSKIN